MRRFFSFLLIACTLLALTAAADEYIGEAVVYVSDKGGTLNFREKASTSSKSLGIVRHGDKVYVIALDDEWSCLYHPTLNCKGYLKTKYLGKYTPYSSAQQVKSAVSVPFDRQIDLDGDGAKESVQAAYLMDEYESSFVRITVTANGKTFACDLPIEHSASAYFEKLDDTGYTYVIIDGDVCSDDYETFCFCFDGSGLYPIVFSETAPFSASESFPGGVAAIQDGYITIHPILDVLGTRGYTLRFHMENGVLAHDGNHVWQTLYKLSDADVWQYCALKTTAVLPAVIYGQETSLPIGSALLITALDVSAQRAYFAEENGACGYFEYKPNTGEYAWGVTIGGISEENAFECIPYAG